MNKSIIDVKVPILNYCILNGYYSLYKIAFIHKSSKFDCTGLRLIYGKQDNIFCFPQPFQEHTRYSIQGINPDIKVNRGSPNHPP